MHQPNFWSAANPGDPVPAVHPIDLKAVWDFHEEVRRQHPGQQVGVDIKVMELACKPGADIGAVTYRSGMLELLLIVPGDLLAPWRQGEQLNEAVFRVAARIPMEWMDTGAPRQGFPFDVDTFCGSCATKLARRPMANGLFLLTSPLVRYLVEAGRPTQSAQRR